MSHDISDKDPQDPRANGVPATSSGSRSPSTLDGPAQGSVETQTRYRDRPADDGKPGVGHAAPEQDRKNPRK
jgi:hypothetical protein